MFSVIGKEESTGRTYMLLGDDGKVPFIYRNPAIMQPRHAGQLAPTSNVTVSKRGVHFAPLQSKGRATESRSQMCKKEIAVKLILSAALCSMAFSSAFAGSQTTKLATEYLMTLYAPLDPPQKIDKSLTIYNVGAGGWVKGPRIKGTLIAPAADWIRVMPGGNLRQDVRLTIKTDDGALIYVTYNGIINRSKEVAKRDASGAVLTSADEYFLMAPTMETSSKAYVWLNYVQCVGKMVEVKIGDNSFVKYDIFVAH